MSSVTAKPSRGHAAPRSERKDTLVSRVLAMPMASYYLVLAATALLIGLGVLMVLSASSVYAENSAGNPYFYVQRQVAFLAIGGPLAWWMSRRSPEFLVKLGWPAWLLGIVLLMLAMPQISPFAQTFGGNTNWVRIGGANGVQLQPSEFAKLALVVWTAALFARKIKVLDQPRHLLVPFVPGAALMVALILAGRDLGTALVIGMAVFALMFFIGTPIRLLAALGGVAAVAVGGLVASSPNRMARIMVWLDPNHHTDIASQPTAALYALATGGWWGLGLGASRQKWGALKNGPHTDFVFAVLGEELGLIGVLVTLALFGVLGYAGFRIAVRSDKPFCRMAAAGITAWFTLQAAINILVVLGLLPVLGVPLPFLSYGGSALLSCLLATGILLACARQEPDARRLLARKKAGPRPRMTSVVDAGTSR